MCDCYFTISQVLGTVRIDSLCTQVPGTESHNQWPSRDSFCLHALESKSDHRLSSGESLRDPIRLFDDLSQAVKCLFGSAYLGIASSDSCQTLLFLIEGLAAELIRACEAVQTDIDAILSLFYHIKKSYTLSATPPPTEQPAKVIQPMGSHNVSSFQLQTLQLDFTAQSHSEHLWSVPVPFQEIEELEDTIHELVRSVESSAFRPGPWMDMLLAAAGWAYDLCIACHSMVQCLASGPPWSLLQSSVQKEFQCVSIAGGFNTCEQCEKHALCIDSLWPS